MALINCSECGKEVSDKAASCPNCGNPIAGGNKEPDEYLACPKCGSKELHSNQKGFSGGKAVVGAVLTGGIGLLAGTIGSKDIQITCLKCGNTFKAGEARIIRDGGTSSLETRVLDKYRSTNSVLECVKLYKDEMKCGLAEAKNSVEVILDRHSIDWKSKSSSGCMVVLAIFAVVGSLLIYSL